jgi:hypothetical protein
LKSSGVGKESNRNQPPSSVNTPSLAVNSTMNSATSTFSNRVNPSAASINLKSNDELHRSIDKVASAIKTDQDHSLIEDQQQQKQIEARLLELKRRKSDVADRYMEFVDADNVACREAKQLEEERCVR